MARRTFFERRAIKRRSAPGGFIASLQIPIATCGKGNMRFAISTVRKAAFTLEITGRNGSEEEIACNKSDLRQGNAVAGWTTHNVFSKGSSPFATAQALTDRLRSFSFRRSKSITNCPAVRLRATQRSSSAAAMVVVQPVERILKLLLRDCLPQTLRAKALRRRLYCASRRMATESTSNNPWI